MAEMNIFTATLEINAEDVVIIENGKETVCYRFFIEDQMNVNCDPFPHTQELRLYGDNALIDMADALNAYVKRLKVSRKAPSDEDIINNLDAELEAHV